MKLYIKARILIGWILLSVLSSQTFGVSEQPTNNIDEVAVVQSNTVASGHLGNLVRKESWTYDNQYDDTGKPVFYEEQINVYAFAVNEAISGPPLPESIEVYIPQAMLESPKFAQTRTLLFGGEQVVVGLSVDSGAKKRGQMGFNISYGQAFSAQSETDLAKIRKWVEDLRAVPEEPVEAQLEDAYAGTGAGDDLNLEIPVDIPDIPKVGQAVDQNPSASIIVSPQVVEIATKALVASRNMAELKNRSATAASAKALNRNSSTDESIWIAFLRVLMLVVFAIVLMQAARYLSRAL